VSTQPTIVVILGNRPQFIKHAALHRAWAARSDAPRAVVVDTGQHYDYELAGVFMEELEIPAPQHTLAAGAPSHAEQLARMLPPIEELLIRERPTSVVVYGDTNSTLGGALAAAKLNIPIAHIEAGLRSYDRTMPEEVNRVLADHMSAMLFCPTGQAVDNLAREGITGEHVHVVGDVMTDVALLTASAARARWETLQAQLGLPDAGEFGVVTVHRAANTEPEALAQLVECLRAADIPLVFPMHPRTQHAFERSGLHVDLADLPNLFHLPPVGYVDLASLVLNSACVLTDSGGLQKEAYIHGVPCITLRDTSEWTETLEHGMNRLVHLDPAAVAAAVADVLAGGFDDAIDSRPPVYGDGDAADRILDVLFEHASASAHLRL
jgi:UDP-N-acetylglucosamine 2-epimerase